MCVPTRQRPDDRARIEVTTTGDRTVENYDIALLTETTRSEAADDERVTIIDRQFREAFDELRDLGRCVTVFGSARFDEDHPYYDLARRTGAAFADAGFAVMTGGGPGIMEAANRGAHDVGGHSIGCTIELPNEQHGNPYLTTEIGFRHFFARKVVLVRYSQAFVMMPGGYGTLDELFETATLIQTGKMPGFPMVLMGTEFWNPITHFVTESLLAEQTISPEDRELFVATDDPEEAVRLVTAAIG